MRDWQARPAGMCEHDDLLLVDPVRPRLPEWLRSVKRGLPWTRQLRFQMAHVKSCSWLINSTHDDHGTDLQRRGRVASIMHKCTRCSGCRRQGTGSWWLQASLANGHRPFPHILADLNVLYNHVMQAPPGASNSYTSPHACHWARSDRPQWLEITDACAQDHHRLATPTGAALLCCASCM